MNVAELLDDPIVLTVVVPCYNEEQTLTNCIDRLLRIQDDKVRLEIIIVDDKSKDNSLEIAHELSREHAEIKVCFHEVNRGKGAALRTGFQHASGDFVCIQDADLEYNPQELRKLLIPLVKGEADVVYGSRYLRPGSRRVLYFWHSLMNRTLTFVSNMFTDLDITDMETCYKMFRRDVIQSIPLQEDRFGFEPEVTAKIAQLGLRVYEMDISYAGRTYDEGKKIGWKDGLRALYCILHYAAPASIIPLQILLYLFIGGVAAVVNITLFSVFHALDLPLAVATVTAFLLAALVNYWLCILLLFRHKVKWTAGTEFLYYMLIVCAIALVDYLLTAALVATGLGPVFAKAIATALCFFFNFFARKYLVFPQKVGEQWRH